MGADPVFIGFLTATHSTLGVAFIGRRKAPRVFQFAVAVCLTWWLDSVAQMIVGPSFRSIYPFVDFGLICLLLRYLVETTGDVDVRKAPWWLSGALTALLIQLAMHTGYKAELPLEARWPYLLCLNVLYVIQLLAIWVGALRGEPLATREAERSGPSPNPAGIETERT